VKAKHDQQRRETFKTTYEALCILTGTPSRSLVTPRPPGRGVMIGVHRVFFSWWLDKRLARRNDKVLGQQIREDLEFLFTVYGAQLVPNAKETPPYFDWAQATVVTSDLRFNFTRDRGTIFANVAPEDFPKDWQELSSVLTAITVGDAAEQEIEFARLPTIARELEPRMALLKAALSTEHFEETKAAVLNIRKRRHIQATLRLQSELRERKRQLGLLK
jgi:hypothetical protein